jgi:hypothetical protein
MKLPWAFYLGILLNYSSNSATGGTVDLAGKQAEPTPIQTPASPGRLSGVVENATLSPEGNDRHYISGLKLSYTTGPLSENSI